MQTLHDILRNRLLAQAGIFEVSPKPTPTLDEIYRKQWSSEFEQAMRNRMAMGYFRYGWLADQIGKAKFDNIASIKQRLSLYQENRNREHLVDVANLCLVEFATHPEYPFIAVDDGIHTPAIRK